MKQPRYAKNLDYYKTVNAEKVSEFETPINVLLPESQQSQSPVNPKQKINYKFSEDLLLEEILNYVNGTYSQHYVGNTKDIQVMDLLLANEPTGTEFSRGAAVKYIMRYGKKSGKNRKDLLKAIHYILFMLYAENMNDEVELNDIK